MTAFASRRTDRPLPTITEQITSSALWAAYADALGFIAEGTDARGLKRRLQGSPVGTVTWRRRIGYQGPDVDLPAGTYSDDTQLRLATARSIRSDGTFDIETFSRVELPLWPLYSLGAGRGSLDAARRLASGKQQWNNLVHGDKSGRYVKGGGNGAAMRVQPIAWVARKRDHLVRDVIVNTASTHGHPKAFVGALFHADLLRETLREGAIPTRDVARGIIADVRGMVSEISKLLGKGWQETWSNATAQIFANVWSEAASEIESLIADIDGEQKNPSSAYKAILQAQNLLTDEERGSATKTAAVAYAALLLYGDAATTRIIQDISTVIGSDTDSIATMAAALLGAARADEMPYVVQDREYLVENARQLAEIASGTPSGNGFHYQARDYRISPARVTWEPKRAYFGGIGTALPISAPVQRRPDGEAYQWHRLGFGQTILLRVPAEHARKSQDESIGLFSHAVESAHINTDVIYANTQSLNVQVAPKPDQQQPRTETSAPPADAEETAKNIARSGFDAARIGRAIMNASRRPYGEGLAAAIGYAVARLAQAEERARITAPPPPKPAPPPEQPPKPEIQLQLRATPDEKGVKVEGSISNFGRSDAYDIRVLLGLQDSPALTFERLAVQERHNISFPAPLPVVRGMPVVVIFKNGDGRYRQEGVFEPAAGVASALLLKGLGDLKPAR